MTGTFFPMPVLRAVDGDGEPLDGALLQFYLTGTTTPTPVYTDSTLGTPLSNPVVADSGGLFVPIYLNPAITYRVQLLTAASSLIRDIDPVAAPVNIASNSITAAMLQSGVAVANIGYTPVNKAGDTASNLLISMASVTGAANGGGYIGAPLNEQDSGYTFVALDTGKIVRANSGSGIAYTIPPNSSVAFPVGTVILVRNVGAGVVTLTRGSGVTMTKAGSGTNQDVALAQYGYGSLTQEAANVWVASGGRPVVTGAVAAAATLGTGGGGGIVTPSPTPVWTSIYGYSTAFSNNQTFSTITTPISISASLGGGSGALLYNLNGTVNHYSGPFTVSAGDALGWGIVVGTGTITVTNVTDSSTVLGTIPYSVTLSPPFP